MTVKFRTGISTHYKGQTLWFHAGTTADIPEELARRFIAAGRAVECAALACPPENQMLAAAQPRKRGRPRMELSK